MKIPQMICEGLGPRLKRTGDDHYDGPCEYYDSLRDDCVLLKEKGIEAMARIGRCTYAVVNFVEHKLGKSFARRTQGLDEREDINFQKMIGRFANVIWAGPLNRSTWFSFLQMAARRMAINVLVRQKFLPRKKECGSCINLSLSKPLECQISGELKKKGDPPCDEYEFVPPFIIAGSDDYPNDSDKDNEANFTPRAIEEFEDVEEKVTNKLDVERLRIQLLKRVEAEREGTRRRAALVRQYDLFVNLHRLLGVGENLADAVRRVAKDLGVSQKTVGRDMDDIRNFLSSCFHT